MMLPPLNSLPFIAFVCFIAFDACWIATKALERSVSQLFYGAEVKVHKTYESAFTLMTFMKVSFVVSSNVSLLAIPAYSKDSDASVMLGTGTCYRLTFAKKTSNFPSSFKACWHTPAIASSSAASASMMVTCCNDCELRVRDRGRLRGPSHQSTISRSWTWD